MQATVREICSKADDPVALVRDLNTLLGFIHRRSSKQFFEVAEELDMSIVQVKALHQLELDEEVSVKELAELLGVSLPATSRTVETLLGRGLLARREDEHDRRVKRVRLTPAGHDAVVRLNSARQADLERFVETLSGRERRRVAEAIKPLIERDEVAACRRQEGT